MAEYIDKDKARQILCADCDNKNLCAEKPMCMEGIAINGLPTIELVRCKDCKHSINGGWCKLHDTGCGQTDYCSWGERKDDPQTYTINAGEV